MNAALFPDLIVNGETVPHTLIAAEGQIHTGPRDKPGIAWRKAANAVAVRILLLQEAHAQGVGVAPDRLGPGRVETDEEVLIRGLLETVIEVETPTAEAVHAEWARDPSRFRAPPLWEVSHILTACDPRDQQATEAARAAALKLCEMLHARPRDFAHIASEHSDCGSKSSGGALGQLAPGDSVPEFEQVLHGLAEGEITAAPVLTRHGWHIIRMDACATGEVLPFEAVRPKIAQAMEKAAWARAAKAYIATLVARAEIAGADLTQVA
jgi:peptidyl-prolyl cis-trans isomerase C